MTGKPRYQQVKDLIVRRIESGQLRPLDRVPSENELADAMGIARMTANRALRELTDEGWVERIAGRGTFVADFRSRSHLLEVHNIADEIHRRGNVHTAEVVAVSRERARGGIARGLGVKQGTDVFHIQVVHCESGTPIQFEDRYLVAGFAPDCLDQDFTRITPSAYLTEKAPLTQAEQIVRADMPNRAVRNRLGLGPSEPCLVVLRRTWCGGRPVSVARLWHPGSRYELSGQYVPRGARPVPAARVPKLEAL